MIVKLLTEHYLGVLSLKGGCTGSFESTHVKIPYCWKFHALAHIWFVHLFLVPYMVSASVLGAKYGLVHLFLVPYVVCASVLGTIYDFCICYLYHIWFVHLFLVPYMVSASVLGTKKWICVSLLGTIHVCG